MTKAPLKACTNTMLHVYCMLIGVIKLLTPNATDYILRENTFKACRQYKLQYLIVHVFLQSIVIILRLSLQVEVKVDVVPHVVVIHNVLLLERLCV